LGALQRERLGGEDGLPSFSPLEDMRFFPSAESSGNIYRGEFFVKKIVRNFYETVPEKIA